MSVSFNQPAPPTTETVMQHDAKTFQSSGMDEPMTELLHGFQKYARGD